MDRCLGPKATKDLELRSLDQHRDVKVYGLIHIRGCAIRNFISDDVDSSMSSNTNLEKRTVTSENRPEECKFRSTLLCKEPKSTPTTAMFGKDQIVGSNELEGMGGMNEMYSSWQQGRRVFKLFLTGAGMLITASRFGKLVLLASFKFLHSLSPSVRHVSVPNHSINCQYIHPSTLILSEFELIRMRG